MSILSSTNTGLSSCRLNVEKWLNDNNINRYNLKKTLEYYPYYTIDVIDSDVNLSGLKRAELPEYIVFNEIIGGNFICTYSDVSTMKGFPKMVGKNLDISFSRITTLYHAPHIVNKDFVACGLSFTPQQISMATNVTNRIYC